MHIGSLYFEGTRRCQSNCRHCLRGLAQNLDITKAMVNTFFENPIESINLLVFGGGEPTLNPEIINSIVDKIVTKNIQLNGFLMRTNGRSLDGDLLDPFRRLLEVYENIQKKFLDILT